jgi:(R)-amidase
MKPTRRDFLKCSTAAGMAGAVATGMAGKLAEAAAPQPGNTKPTAKATIRIAVVQQNGNPGHVKENRTKALRFAQQALDHGADVILFHEELLVGYCKNLRELAEPLDGPSVRAFQTLLKQSPAFAIVGLTEREGDRCYVAATVIGAGGVVANYRKTHLWWAAGGLRHEPTFYTPGDRLVTFDVRGHKSGLMICYDGDFPEMARSYANLDCRMLFWMNNRGSRGHEEVHRLASSNSIIIAASCCCGPNESGDRCRGGSNITDARGKLLCELWDREGVIYADVKPEEVVNIRNGNPWWRGQRGDLYYYPDKTGAAQSR